MTEYHDYSDKNISICKTCKEIYDSFHGEEDREIDDWHVIVAPLCKNKSKKIYYDATIKDLYEGVNIRMKPGYTGLSQAKAYEVVIEEEEEKEDSNTNVVKTKK